MNVAGEDWARLALGAIIVGAALIALPPRLRADRVGGRGPRGGDPRWFWPGMTVVGLPVLAVIAGFLVKPRNVDFALLPLSPAWRLAGIPAGLAGLLLLAWVFRHLGLNVTSTATPRQEATLVTSGPYRWVRHPMYTTALLLAAAAALLSANAIVAAGGGAAFFLLAARSRLEEVRLVEKFGSAYRDYQHRTGRFLPRGRGKR